MSLLGGDERDNPYAERFGNADATDAVEFEGARGYWEWTLD